MHSASRARIDRLSHWDQSCRGNLEACRYRTYPSPRKSPSFRQHTYIPSLDWRDGGKSAGSAVKDLHPPNKADCLVSLETVQAMTLKADCNEAMVSVGIKVQTCLPYNISCMTWLLRLPGLRILDGMQGEAREGSSGA